MKYTLSAYAWFNKKNTEKNKLANSVSKNDVFAQMNRWLIHQMIQLSSTSRLIQRFSCSIELKFT